MTVNTSPRIGYLYAAAVIVLWLIADWLGVVVAAVVSS